MPLPPVHCYRLLPLCHMDPIQQYMHLMHNIYLFHNRHYLYTRAHTVEWDREDHILGEDIPWHQNMEHTTNNHQFHVRRKYAHI